MIIIGAKGHAKDILSVLSINKKLDHLYFYDDVSPDSPQLLYGVYPILRSANEAKKVLEDNADFVLGIGNPKLRCNLANKFKDLGGTLRSVIAPTSSIGNHEVKLGAGINIMTGVIITNSVIIGEGALINAGVQIHHDVSVGRYTELSPGVILTGGVSVGEFTIIGTGAKVLPNIKIGDHVVVGAGAIVTKDIPSFSQVVGIPARIVKFSN
ncbi:acetyltransferase [Pontibacter sp. SGAir0037]|uniref:acetyltransferase n=1 Tax=Pontibacter sp. SGAir0037 TaxID=2571030 RepID=UPI0010CCC3C2|nr:acetyltransferase [Pontibacter sp. SGAir0037]QCR23489.1 hexapeptide transferase [Pontibacter sp. SGAir0037]